MIRSLLAFLLSTFLVFRVNAQSQVAREQQPQVRAELVPTLIVVITVDQLLPEYFERYGAQLTGGLGRVYRGGAVFTNAYHDHATTETAPGHASILSGRFPRSTGIVRNNAGVQDAQTPLIGAQGAGASPFRFRGSTLTDWLRSRTPSTRALSVSGKDRGAILPLGRARQSAYWYASNGHFTTSTYYRDTLPEWVRAFNDRKLPARMAGRPWKPLLAASSYPERDSIAAESGGKDFSFPHLLPADTSRATQLFPNYPWLDEVTLEFALAGMRSLDLGNDAHTDVLAVSLSATDYIGHQFGPDSREIHDQILRLDRSLGAFVDTLYSIRDSARVVIALTADHGVAPLPELRKGARRVDLSGILKKQLRTLAAKGLDTSALRFDLGMLFIDRTAFGRAPAEADAAVKAFAAEARAHPAVLRVDLVHKLAADTARDAIARRWFNSIPQDMPAELVVTLRPYSVWDYGVPIAMHGSPHDYDAHVPVIFYGPPFATGRYDTFVRVVDMAPTLAWIADTQPTERLDGRVLRQALRRDAAK
ncbi:MAG: alkaline phosphatase family protein [Gemmatimonadaceae bacterium]